MPEKLEKATVTGRFEFSFEIKTGTGTSFFSKSSVFKMLSVHLLKNESRRFQIPEV